MNAVNSTALFPREQEAIDAFVIRLRQRYPDRISEILLFGSKARGDSGPESDIDILVVPSTGVSVTPSATWRRTCRWSTGC
jgi:predicted nucleotidyltransferase